MIVLAKQHFAYLVKQHLKVQFVWTDEPDSIVLLSFYLRGQLTNDSSMSRSEARKFWNTMRTNRGYAKGVKCSTHLGK